MLATATSSTQSSSGLQHACRGLLRPVQREARKQLSPSQAAAVALLHARLKAELDAQTLLPFMAIHMAKSMQLRPGFLILKASVSHGTSIVKCHMARVWSSVTWHKYGQASHGTSMVKCQQVLLLDPMLLAIKADSSKIHPCCVLCFTDCMQPFPLAKGKH